MLILGILWGLAWGWALARALRSVYNDTVIEISLTIGASYLCARGPSKSDLRACSRRPAFCLPRAAGASG